MREWKAWVVCRRMQLTPRSPSRRSSVRHRLRGPAHDAEVRAVGGRDARAPVEQRPDLLLGERHGEHGAAGQLLDELRPPRHQGQRVVQRERAGEAGGHVLADAVADHGLRAGFPRPSAAGPGRTRPRSRPAGRTGAVDRRDASSRGSVPRRSRSAGPLPLPLPGARDRARRAPRAGRAPAGAASISAQRSTCSRKTARSRRARAPCPRLVAQAGEEEDDRALSPRGR